MRNKIRRGILLTGILCVMSFMVCACGKDKAAVGAEEQQSDSDDSDPAGDVLSPKASADEEEAGAAQDFPPEAKADGTGADPAASDSTGTEKDINSADSDTRKEQAEAQDTPSAWEDSAPDLEGTIKELQDGRLTVVEAVTGTDDDEGGTIIATPAPGADDSEFNKVTVTYDEKTLFAIKTIYDGGARSEMEEATAQDLENDRSVEVWGGLSGGELKATQICILYVIR
ncbi:MAG: hypothetical protein K1W10_09890 [Lachnospiraceae bacterium]